MNEAQIWTTVYDAINSIEVNAISSVFKLILSLLLGCVVGYERKKRGQPAGVRTFSLIAMGSTLAMILSIYVPQEYLGLKNGDPGRIAAQVVTGIGFLGAGAIIQMKGSVRGLTTAAGIWMVAAIGMAVGVGMYAISIIATLLILIILVWLDKIEHKANIGTELRTLRIQVDAIIESIKPYKEILDEHKIGIARFNINYNYQTRQTDLNLIVLIPEGADIFSIIDSIREINPTVSLALSNQTVI